MAKRKCMTCGNTYSYCGSCYKDRLKPSWYSNFCSNECHELDRIISSNTFNLLTDIEAKHELEKLNLSEIEFKNTTIKKRIDELLSIPEEVISELKVDTNDSLNAEDINEEERIDTTDINDKTIKTVGRNNSKRKRTNNNE